MKEFLKKELYSFRAVAAILARWLLLAVPTGLVCGAVGTAFHQAVEHVTEWRAEHIWLLWLLPVAGLAIVALYKVTGCEGMGTNTVIRAVHSGESVSPLLVPAIFFGTVLTHLCGGSAGREGAALQMGGSIGYNIAKLFRFSDHDRRTATACGMAAFFSALFGTPLSATLFGIMVEDVGLAFSVAFVPGFAAALIAYGVSLACGISPTHFELTAPALSIDSTLLVAVLGVACALVARAFCWLLHTMEHEMPRRLPNPWVRAVVGGVAVVALSYLMGVGRYNGAGMGVITAAVEQGQALYVEKLDAAVGETVELPVLMVVDGEKTTVGTPVVEDVVAKAKVVAHGKSKKVIVFKYKPKKNYRKKTGHRQPYTKIEIESLGK